MEVGTRQIATGVSWEQHNVKKIKISFEKYTRDKELS